MSVSTMKKLTVLSYRADADAIVRKLMNLRCVEILSTDVGTGAEFCEHLDRGSQKEQANARLRSIREVLPALTKYTRRKKKLGRIQHRVNREEFLSDGRAEKAWSTVEKTVALNEKIGKLTAEQSQTETRMEALIPWLDYDVPLNVEGSKKTALILGAFPGKTAEETVRTALDDVGAYYEAVSASEHGLYCAIVCHTDDEEEVNRVLASFGFVRTLFKDINTTAQVEYDRSAERLQEIGAELDNAQEMMRVLADDLDLVEILSDIEETNAIAASQLQKLAVTKNCAFLEGWIPVFTKDAVEKALSKFDCAYEIADPEEGEEPPVLLRNNRFAMNFEWVIGMYAYPRYGAYDPTFIMSIFYFLIFGLMFADVGYGLLLVAACFGGVKLLNPRTGLKRMMMMFGYCGISSIVMGLIFGGWFGDLPTAVMSNLLHVSTDSTVGHFFGSGLWFNPLDEPMTFLILSLAVGAVHLIAGMIINFVLMCKRGRTAEALCTVAPYWVLFAGLILIVLGLAGDAFATVAGIGKYVALAGVVLILLLNGYGNKNIFKRLLKGFGGLYGLINYASDLLSYSRILALGLVAGVIAKVINLITLMGSGGVIGFFIMLIVLLVGHALNLAINVLGTFVHTSRLQYIEFFGKFYEDGGQPFVPAADSDRYTEFSETQTSL